MRAVCLLLSVKALFLSFNHPAQLSAEQITKRQYMITYGQLIQVPHSTDHGSTLNTLPKWGQVKTDDRMHSILIDRSMQF
jgi:hypothetical protein